MHPLLHPPGNSCQLATVHPFLHSTMEGRKRFPSFPKPASQSISPPARLGKELLSQSPDIDMPLQSAGSHKVTKQCLNLFFPLQKTLSWIFSAVQKTKTLKLKKHHEITEPATNCAFHTSHAWRGLAEAKRGHNYAGCVSIPPVSRIGDIGGVHSSPKHHAPFWD